MYAYIKGRIEDLEGDAVIVENQGIGYRIYMPSRMLKEFMGVGEEVKIYTYLHIREDAQILYGFTTKDEMEVFKLLIGVSGIGPKGALGILSELTTDELRFAILADDAKTISKAPGVGAKTAKRMIIELKDKLSLEDAFEQKLANDTAATGTSLQSQKINEAVEALTALGYSSTESLKAVRSVEMTESTTVEELLKASLKQMSFL